MQQPPPLVKSFLVCSAIFQDTRTHTYILIGPTGGFVLPRLPWTVEFAVYGCLSEVRGAHALELRVENPDGESIWDRCAPFPTQPDNPLAEHPFVFYDNAVRFDDPGTYDLLLLADENEVARHPLKILLAGVPEEG
jgi:hypothetical protein